MLDLKHLNLQYVTNEAGQKKAVILPMEEFIELLEDLDDLARLAERRDEPSISLEELILDLKQDGTLPD